MASGEQHHLEFGGSPVTTEFPGKLQFRRVDRLPVISLSHRFDEETAREVRYQLVATVGPERPFYHRYLYVVLDVRMVDPWAPGSGEFVAALRDRMATSAGSCSWWRTRRFRFPATRVCSRLRKKPSRPRRPCAPRTAPPFSPACQRLEETDRISIAKDRVVVDLRVVHGHDHLSFVAPVRDAQPEDELERRQPLRELHPHGPSLPLALGGVVLQLAEQAQGYLHVYASKRPVILPPSAGPFIAFFR